MQELSGITLNTPESIESEFANGNLSVRRDFVSKIDAGKIQNYFLIKRNYRVHIEEVKVNKIYHMEIIKLGENQNA